MLGLNTMTGLLFKLSYNIKGDSQVQGGICGSFFLLKQNEAITAHHLLNKENMKPNIGYAYCQYWIIFEPDIVEEININQVKLYPEIDTTIIKIKRNLNAKIRKIAKVNATVGQECYNEGFKGGEMPHANVSWEANRLKITNCFYKNTRVVSTGYIKSIQNITQNANDVKINNIKGYETSYGGVIGMSGGPLINKETDEIIGLMSIGLPPDNYVKKTLFAISFEEIEKRI